MTRASLARKKRRHEKVVDLHVYRRQLEGLRNLRKLVGYYTRADQRPEEPDYDPPHDGPCLICGQPIVLEECRTVSVVWAKQGHKLALFYRLHRACDDATNEHASMELDHVVLRVGDEIEKDLRAKERHR